MKSNGNGWLRGRSEILGRYAQGLPDGQDRIQVAFDGPDYGWMPVHFIKNGVDMGFVEFSDVYDCFEPLREWLESVACNQCSNASVVNLDCEDWQAVLYYEPICFGLLVKTGAEKAQKPKNAALLVKTGAKIVVILLIFSIFEHLKI